MRKRYAVFAILAMVIAPAMRPAQEPAPKAAPAAKPQMILVAPDDLKYGPLPAQFIVGKPSVETSGTLEVAIVAGDPSKPGPFTVRARCSDGYKIAPHWHPTTENVTVLQGAMGIGMGSKWDSDALKPVPTNGFFSMPGSMRHYAQCNGDTTIQIHANGPFKFIFASPAAASPAKKTSTKKTAEK